jgi:OOP family OmpA-OmpF porin
LKRIAIVLASAAASLASSGAMAQAYVGADVGEGHFNVDCTGETTSCKTSNTASKFTVGYTYWNGISAEVGYIDFGKVQASNSTSSVELKASALTFGAAYAIPLSSSWGLDVRLGVASVKTDVNATVAGLGSGSDSDSKAEIYSGLGLSYRFANHWSANVSADFSTSDYQGNKASVSAVTVGLRYHF